MSRSARTGRGTLGAGRWGGRGAFTLIEVLVAITILTILASFLVAGLGGMRKKALAENTNAMLKKIAIAIGEYQNEFRQYPPDGYDNEPRMPAGMYDAAKGILLGPTGNQLYFRGSGCLLYFLCRPQTNITYTGASGGGISKRQMRVRNVGPYLELSSGSISIENFEVQAPWKAAAAEGDFPSQFGASGTDAIATVDIIDAWKRPICYDKVTEKGAPYFLASIFDTPSRAFASNATYVQVMVTPASEGEAAEACTEELHNIDEDIETIYDPRRAHQAAENHEHCVDLGATPSPKNVGAFDLWSPGPLWSNPCDDMGNW